MPEAGRRRIERVARARPVVAPLEAVVGVDDQRRAVLLRAAHPLSQQAVDQRVVLVDDAVILREVGVARAGQARRHVRGEHVAHDVRALEVEHRQVREVPVVELAGDARGDARGADRPRESDERLAQAVAARAGGRDVGERHVDEARELLVRDRALARRDLLDARRERGRVGEAVLRKPLEENRARVIRSRRSPSPPRRDACPTSPRRRPYSPRPRRRSRSPARRASHPRSGPSGRSSDRPPGSRGRGGRPGRRRSRASSRSPARESGTKALSFAVEPSSVDPLPVRHAAPRRRAGRGARQSRPSRPSQITGARPPAGRRARAATSSVSTCAAGAGVARSREAGDPARSGDRPHGARRERPGRGPGGGASRPAAQDGSLGPAPPPAPRASERRWAASGLIARERWKRRDRVLTAAEARANQRERIQGLGALASASRNARAADRPADNPSPASRSRGRTPALDRLALRIRRAPVPRTSRAWPGLF